MNRNEKPVVTFSTILGWSDREDSGVRAYLLDVQDHPTLGNKSEVLTSSVLSIEYDAAPRGQVCCIETRNTLYKRRDGGVLAAQED